MKSDKQLIEETEFILSSCRNQLWVAHMLAGSPDIEDTVTTVTKMLEHAAQDGGPKEALILVAREVIRLLT